MRDTDTVPWPRCYYCGAEVPPGNKQPRCTDRTECPSYRLPDGSQPEREAVKYSPTEPPPGEYGPSAFVTDQEAERLLGRHAVEYGASQYAVWAAG